MKRALVLVCVITSSSYSTSDKLKKTEKGAVIGTGSGAAAFSGDVHEVMDPLTTQFCASNE